ncbi:hypothetical protein GCM10027431_12390 [Lysobacter rhizosphaerae]
MQQDGGGFHRFQARIRVEFDLFAGHQVLRRLHHVAVDGHPTVLDVLLGVGARAAEQFGDAMGKANRSGHDRGRGNRTRSVAISGAGSA